MSCTPNSRSGVVVLRSEAHPSAFGGEPRGFVGSSAEQGAWRATSAGTRRTPGGAAWPGDMRVDPLLHGGKVAQFEEVDDPPVDALQLRLAVSRNAGRLDELVRHGESLLDIGVIPERDVPRVQRLQQCAAADAATARECLLTQAFTDRRGAVVQLDSQPGQQSRSKGRRGIDTGDRLLEQRANLGTHGRDDDRQSGGSQRGAGEEHAIVRRARQARGLLEAAPCPVRLPDTGACVAEREQQPGAQGVREVQLRQRAVQERRGVLVAELGDRAFGRPQHDLRDRGRIDQWVSIEQVAREIRQSRLASVGRQTLYAVGDPTVQQRLARRRQAAEHRRADECVPK